jgi:hypothetical protein
MAYAVLDQALERLAAYAPDLSNGFTNHAPMAAEALCAMGRDDAVLPWLEKNWALRGKLLPRAKATRPFTGWQTALGNGFSEDWAQFLGGEFEGDDWSAAIARWTARLAPGISTGALHGVIRVGHAARALAERDTPLRRRELRDAFGYWAAHYQALPDGVASRRPMPAHEAIRHVTRVPREKQRRAGSITGALRVLESEEDFSGVIGLLDVGGDFAATLTDVTGLFARVYLTNAVDGMGVITFIHGVTGAAALRSLLPYLPDDVAREALRRIWQADAALYAALAVAPPLDGDVMAPSVDTGTLIDRAVATADEHAIKFTEALLREHALKPSPVYLAAAEHAIGAL